LKLTAKIGYALLLGSIAIPSLAATWYVRPDGGTRYSADKTEGQCDGQADAPYPGKGTNRHCAFKDVRSLWHDGAYIYDGDAKHWKWVISGGDTVIIRGSIGTGVSYRVGWNGNSYCDSVQCYGFTGNPYGSGAPPPPSGTPTQHTRILGENYQSCHAPSARTQIHGGYGVNTVLNMAGASYVDIACLDITDFSGCGRAGQTHGCNSNMGQLDDYANTGIGWSNTSTHDTLTDVRIHGMAQNGMGGPTGDGMVFSYLDLVGNASSGWNADPSNGTTGSGSLLVQHYDISWNGCAEEYPIKDPLPYGDCTDDNGSGYGDGFGTATLGSNPGWTVTFDQGTTSYNTQDGLDALHIGGSGSTMTVTHTLAYGNMGQQLKVGGALGTLKNNVIYTNCNALRQDIPGTPKGYNARLSDFCRAADAGVKITVNDDSTTVFENNTLLSASATALEVDVNVSCKTSTCLIQQRNNIFVGFKNDKNSGYPNGGNGEYSNPIYVDEGAVKAYRNPGSSFDHNVTFHAKSNWSCPATSIHEKDAMCGDPHLKDQTWHNYGFGDTTVTGPLKFGGSSSGSIVSAPVGASGIEPQAMVKYVGGSVVLLAGAWQGVRLMRKNNAKVSGDRD
jgi:hypothetical protein